MGVFEKFSKDMDQYVCILVVNVYSINHNYLGYVGTHSYTINM